MNGEANANPYNPHYLHCCEQAGVNPDSKAVQKIYAFCANKYNDCDDSAMMLEFVELVELFKEVRG